MTNLFSILKNGLILLLFVWMGGCATQKHSEGHVVWKVEELLTAMEPEHVSVEGDPVRSSQGGVVFDGDGDRILVHNNPVSDVDEFTIEMKIYPRAAFPNNVEPRILHIESEEYPDRRITLELRLNDNNKWYFDGFIKSDFDKLTLIDPQLEHPLEQWYQVAITYKEGVFTSWVNGERELSGRVQFQPLSARAKVSIGARMNRIHWFKGDIERVFFYNTALDPKQLKKLMD